MTDKDYYAILEISRNASAKEIKQAYRRLARRYHPDLHPGDKFDEDMFKAVNEAYEVLSDPEKRREYDRLQNELSSSSEYYYPSRADAPVKQVPKKRAKGYVDRFFGWIEQIGFGRFLLVALLLLIILPLAVHIFSDLIIHPSSTEVDVSLEKDDRDVGFSWIGETRFQEEVLESQIPAVVVFCDSGLWQGNVYYEDSAMRTQGFSGMAAIRLIVEEGKYKNKIKFFGYRWTRNDPILKKYQLEWYPRVIIFTNGEVFKDASLTKGTENMEKILTKAINKM
jgi:hypothetical protein